MLNKESDVLAIPSDITDSEDKELYIYPKTNIYIYIYIYFLNPSCGE